MIPTYTNEYREGVILEYLSFNLVSFLIYKPSLGLSDSPTVSELEGRRNLTMNIAASAEVGSANLNGYKRQIVSLSEPTDSSITSSTNVQGTTEFTAQGGSIGPFTHIVIARGADLRNITVSNGNNRGNNTGTVIFVEPVIEGPIILQAPFTYQHTFNFTISTRPIT